MPGEIVAPEYQVHGIWRAFKLFENVNKIVTGTNGNLDRWIKFYES